jgi:hypothetical protein
MEQEEAQALPLVSKTMTLAAASNHLIDEVVTDGL